MKTRIVSLAILAFMLSACAGRQARNSILIPTMEGAWGGVRTDAELGGANPEVLDAYEQALAQRDITNIVAGWPAIFTAAQTGIESRNSSPGVKASLTERLRNFDESVEKLMGGGP